MNHGCFRGGANEHDRNKSNTADVFFQPHTMLFAGDPGHRSRFKQVHLAVTQECKACC